MPERPSPIAGIVTGLEAEAAVLRGAANVSHPDRLPFIACAGAERARAAAQRLLTKGAEALISFGIAGGLDPALRPGRLIVRHEQIEPFAGAGTVGQVQCAAVGFAYFGALLGPAREVRGVIRPAGAQIELPIETGLIVMEKDLLSHGLSHEQAPAA